MRPYLTYGFRQALDDACLLSKVVQFFRATNRAFVRQFAIFTVAGTHGLCASLLRTDYCFGRRICCLLVRLCFVDRYLRRLFAMPSRLTHTSCSLVRGFEQAYGPFARCIGNLVPFPCHLRVIWEAELPTS